MSKRTTEKSMGSFWAQIAANKRRSGMLVLLFIILIAALGWLIGEAWMGEGRTLRGLREGAICRQGACSSGSGGSVRWS